MDFDSRQLEVISLDSGPHLVLAPAGCGKTAILAERVSRALQSGINPAEMLCLTFTNRASRGMRQRVDEIAGERAGDMFIGNTHRFCSRFLFENGIISQSSSILDEDDTLSIIDSTSSMISGGKTALTDCASLGFEDRRKLTAVIQLQHLMRQFRLGHSNDILICTEGDYCDRDRRERFFSFGQFEQLCIYSGLPYRRQSLLDIYDTARARAASAEYGLRFDQLLRLMEAAKAYEAYKEEHQLVDFDDLLIETYDYARHNPETIQKYRWIQIDEVQDLNPLQFAIVDAFTARDHVTVYLGDEQQAIFSFIGAKLATLGQLKERCCGNIHHLDKCYRSPKYLLDVFNDYANLELDTDPELLPQPNNTDAPGATDLLLYYARNSESAVHAAARLARDYSQGRTAILVSSNADADAISTCLGDTAHFKISGTDVFATPQLRMLLAHLNVVSNEHNFLAWARLLSMLKLTKTYPVARKFMKRLRDAAVCPTDFLLYPGSAYTLEFIRHYGSEPVVVFDTETTGLDIYSDDIVQIAADKYIGGEKVDSLNIILETNREIPAKLGDIVNPLVEEYARRPKLHRSEGLRQLLDFARGCVLVGHNVEYDYRILIENCRRDLPDADIPVMFPQVYDTLKLARILCPQFKSYKLKDLLTALQLEGQNSHLADEDIAATFSLAQYLLEKARSLKSHTEECIIKGAEWGEQFRQAYGKLYCEAVDSLYRRRAENEPPALTAEIVKAYDYFIEKGYIHPLDKLHYISEYLDRKVIDLQIERSLYEQLYRHIMDLNTFREADLCDSDVVSERIFVATVHKAKGLEFDNVIVYGCVDDAYPFFASKSDPNLMREDARKLYVALTRAKRRLCLLAYNEKVVYSARYNSTNRFRAELSPFLSRVIARHPFRTVSE